MKPSEVIEKVNGLIGESYFEDPANPRTCRTCAIGALIQALPEDKLCVVLSTFNTGVKQFYLDDISFYNDKLIKSIKPLVIVLQDEYKLTEEELDKLQEINDGYYSTTTKEKFGIRNKDSRKASVLKYLKAIGK